MSSCYAECQEPDILEHKQCTIARCGEGMVVQEGCADICKNRLQEQQDNYIKCTEQEKKLAEQKLLEELQVNDQDKSSVSKGKGKVSIKQADGTWKELSVGTILKDGDIIKTGPKSSFTIQLPDGNIVSVGPNSVFTYQEDSSHYRLNLMIGRLKAWVKKYGKRFEVRTPCAVTSVRGTEFIVEHDAAANITTIYLYEGIVDVNNTKGETFELNAGKIMTVDSSGKTDKSELSEDDWNGLTQSIETGEEFIPGQKTVDSGEQKTRMPTYLIAIAIALLIAFGALLAKKLKKKQ